MAINDEVTGLVVNKLFGSNTNGIEFQARQFMWGQTVIQGVTQIGQILLTGGKETMSTVQGMVAAGWDPKDPMLVKMVENQLKSQEILLEVQKELQGLQKPVAPAFGMN